jgi:hypothetical protein
MVRVSSPAHPDGGLIDRHEDPKRRGPDLARVVAGTVSELPPFFVFQGSMVELPAVFRLPRVDG